MPRPNRLKQALRAEQPVFGLFCSTPVPIVVEMIGCAGFDFVIIDTEHALVNPETLENMVRAADVVGLTALVRVPDASSGAILRALDAGAGGVVVPRMRSRDDAQRAVTACRYYPDGERGLNAGRAAEFGKIDLNGYVQMANREILVVLMIEDRHGVEALPEILSVPGIDLILEGAADLSQSLGIPWQTRHPLVREALQRIQTTSRQHDVPFCAIPRVPEDVGHWLQQGVRAFVLGDERGIAFRALQAHLRQFTQHVQQS